MLGDLYCGKCHEWMVEIFPNAWVCNCTISGQTADTSKNPNCHNTTHAHYDPQSPIVLMKKGYEEWAEEDERIAEECLPAATEALHADCVLYGHVWVRVGTVVSAAIMRWGPPLCLRCRKDGSEPPPEDEEIAVLRLPANCPECGCNLLQYVREE